MFYNVKGQSRPRERRLDPRLARHQRLARWRVVEKREHRRCERRSSWPFVIEGLDEYSCVQPECGDCGAELGTIGCNGFGVCPSCVRDGVAAAHYDDYLDALYSMDYDYDDGHECSLLCSASCPAWREADAEADRRQAAENEERVRARIFAWVDEDDGIPYDEYVRKHEKETR